MQWLFVCHLMARIFKIMSINCSQCAIQQIWKQKLLRFLLQIVYLIAFSNWWKLLSWYSLLTLILTGHQTPQCKDNRKLRQAAQKIKAGNLFCNSYSDFSFKEKLRKFSFWISRKMFVFSDKKTLHNRHDIQLRRKITDCFVFLWRIVRYQHLLLIRFICTQILPSICAASDQTLAPNNAAKQLNLQ